MKQHEGEGIEAATGKSPGRIAYEQDVATCPNYDNGTRRASWSSLPDFVRGSWERNPTPRSYRSDGSHPNAAINTGCCCAPDKREAICIDHGTEEEGELS
jgi:hypothetical protein